MALANERSATEISAQQVGVGNQIRAESFGGLACLDVTNLLSDIHSGSAYLIPILKRSAIIRKI